MVKNCVKVDNIFCYFMLFTWVSGYIFKIFCISVGMAPFIGNVALKLYGRQLFILKQFFSYSSSKSVYFNINTFFYTTVKKSISYVSLTAFNLRFLSNSLSMGFAHLETMLKCLNILNIKLLIIVLYFYKKRILQRTLLMSGGTTLKERYFFARYNKFLRCND